MGCCCCFEGWLSYRQTVPKCCFKNQDYWGKASHTNPWKTHPVSSHSLTHILVKFSYDCETYIYYTYLDVSSLASVFFSTKFLKSYIVCMRWKRGALRGLGAAGVCIHGVTIEIHKRWKYIHNTLRDTAPFLYCHAILYLGENEQLPFLRGMTWNIYVSCIFQNVWIKLMVIA